VTRNLEIALRHLRLPDKGRALWIDALCIDQDDFAERSAEVSRMGTIYGRASQVIVWLGSGSEDSTLAMGTLHRIGQEVVYDEAGRRVSARYCTETALLEDNDCAIMDTRENWIAVKNVFDRDWFKRLWVIQEIKLASHAVVKLGYCDIPLRMFESAFYGIWAYVTQHIKVFDQIDFPRSAFLMGRGPSYTLVPLINYTKFSLCSNSGDRVYAIMSLLDPRHRLGIEPDYRLRPEKIYKDFTLRFIKAYSFLDVLQLCTMRGQGLPS
jgi:hypothetical protein